MHILFATNFFPPTHTAGTETYTYGLARAFREGGHTVGVVCAGTFDAGDSPVPDATTDSVDGISVTRLHFNWQRADDIFMTLAENDDVGRWFAAHLRAVRPDIVHVTSCDTLSPRVITVAKEMGIPVVVTLTDFWFLCMRHTLLKGDGTRCGGPENPWGCLRCLAHDAKVYTIPRAVLPEPIVRTGLTWMSTKPVLTRQRGMRGVLGDVARRQETVRAALLRADAIISPSAFLREIFVRNGYSQECITVSPHGHDHSWLPSDVRKADGFGIRVGYLGQIEPLKGVDLLVRSFHQLDAPEATLTIHGNHLRNPSYTAELSRLSDGDPRIRIAGPFTHDERAEVLRNLDVVVVPSRWYENAPLVISEAFAMKTPVIAANLGGMAEAIQDGVNGLLFAPDDANSLAHCLQHIMEDPRLLPRLSAGIQPSREVSNEASELYLLYQQLMRAATPQGINALSTASMSR